MTALVSTILRGGFSWLFLAGDTNDSGPLTEVTGLSEVRAQLQDDISTCLPAARRCGEGCSFSRSPGSYPLCV